VTAAKSIVNGHCGIDMLAGPSEVLVICDDTANPEVVAADLIAFQAERTMWWRAILLLLRILLKGECVCGSNKSNCATIDRLATLEALKQVLRSKV
jgi:histidinol dehydrogenase